MTCGHPGCFTSSGAMYSTMVLLQAVPGSGVLPMVAQSAECHDSHGRGAWVGNHSRVRRFDRCDQPMDR